MARSVAHAATPSTRMASSIVGHGTRDERGCAEFAELVPTLSRPCPATIVEGCFLELVEPDVLRGVARAIRARSKPSGRRPAAARVGRPCQARHSTAGRGGRRAISRRNDRADAASRFARGRARSRSAPLCGSPGRSRSGSARRNAASDRRAGYEGSEPPTRPCATLPASAASRARAGWLETCFLAMTEPSLEQALRVLPHLPFRRVVVEPHLLFQGELLDRVRAMVADGSAALAEP